jgi:hypothetical protein
MKIQDAINGLQNLLDAGETDVVIAWWERCVFEDMQEKTISKSDFAYAAEQVDDNMEWSHTYEQVEKILFGAIAEK